MKKTEITPILALLTAHDGRTIGNADIELWWEALSKYSVAEVKSALVKAIETVTGERIKIGHVIGNIKDANRHITEKLEVRNSAPCPNCEHGIKLTACEPCADDLASRWVCSAHGEIFIRCIPCHDAGIYNGHFSDIPQDYKSKLRRDTTKAFDVF